MADGQYLVFFVHPSLLNTVRGMAEPGNKPGFGMEAIQKTKSLKGCILKA